VIGHKLQVWWLDPLGAGLLSLFIIFDWGSTAFDNVIRLSGSAVDDRMLRKLVFLAWRFHPVVDGFKNIKVCHNRQIKQAKITSTVINIYFNNRRTMLATVYGWRLIFS
jgi:divalent metal cation (Fe/Co/Zn/Cd) transporter